MIDNEFGLTNDTTEMLKVKAWKEAAIQDGWTCEPTYKNLESEDRAASLRKDGFRAMILTRDNGNKYKYTYEAKISIWGPDRLAIDASFPYSWEQTQSGVKTCSNCQRTDVETFRYSFAGRACAECLPSLQKTHEAPGWNR